MKIEPVSVARWKSIALVAVVVAASTGLGSAEQAGRAGVAVPTDALPGELRALGERLRAAPLRCVPFVQTKKLASLDRELRFLGELSIAPDRRIIWSLRSPLQVDYQFLPTGAYRRGGNGVYQRMAVPDAASRGIHDVLTALLDLRIDTLTRRFTVSRLGSAPLRFRAVPRDARLRSVIAAVEVTAAERIEELRVREADGNVAVYRFAAAPGARSCVLPGPP